MLINEFYEFCDIVIKQYINEIKNEDKNFQCLVFNEKNIRKIYVYYERKRLEIRNLMKDPNKLLDRHKIAAIMMYAILKSKIFKVNRLVPNIPETLLLANEYLAFYVAINIIEMYKREDDSFEFRDNYLLFFPLTYNTNPDHGEHTFEYNTCKGLSCIKNIEHFDVMAYSTILFQMEKYTDVLLLFDKFTKHQEGQES